MLGGHETRSRNDVNEEYGVLDGALLKALPVQVHSELARWQERTHCKLHLVRTLTNGFTDAFVAVVTANDPHGGRKLVLKAARGHATNEAKAHEAALRDAPEKFAQDHLVVQEFEPLVLADDWFVMFQGVAGGGLSDYKPLSTYSRRAELSQLMVKIARSVVHEWSPSPSVRELSILDFLGFHVREKLAEGGTLRAWGMSTCGARIASSTYLRFESKAGSEPNILNPFHLWNQAMSSDVKLHALMGKSHGDLHQENVLVNVTADHGQTDYRLIDLATYIENAPLSRDFTNLFLSEVERELGDLHQDARTDLMRVLTSNQRDVTNDIAAIVALWDGVRTIVDEQSKERGVGDEWRLQMDLSLAGAALQSASRSHRSQPERLWFFELAARLIHQVVDTLHRLPSPDEDAYKIDIPWQKTTPEVETTAVAVASACAQFTGECLTIAILDGTEYHESSLSRFSAWDVILDFDPFSDRGGFFETAKGLDNKHRWFSEADGAVTNSVSTLWVPGVPLASPSGHVADTSLRQWRSSRLPDIRKAMQNIIASHPGTVTVVQFGTSTPRVRAGVEAIIDISGDRANLVVIANDMQAEISELDPIHYAVDPIQVLSHLPPRRSSFSGEASVITIPGGGTGERIAIDESALNWYSDVGELLHSKIDTVITEEERLPGDFYRGRKISWLELSERRDIPRKVTNPRRKKIEERISKRGTYREMLKHVPGAGGTTVARRLVWDLHELHPVLVVEDIPDVGPLFDRISGLAEMTQRQCVVLIERASDTAVTELYNKLTARSTPVSLIVVSRRVSQTHVDAAQGVGLLSQTERGDFGRVFTAHTSDEEAHKRIYGIGLAGGDPSVPFFYALNAFQKDYKGLGPFVSTFVSQQREDVRDSLVDIALAHRFGRKSLPTRIISRFLGDPYGSNGAVRAKFADSAENLLLEEPLGCWRTSHELVANELIEQLLGSTDGAIPRGWKLDLLTRSKDLIIRISEAYPDEVPELAIELLRAIFIERDFQDEFDWASRALFSELINTIPTYSEREELFAALTSHFPNQPHFIAHHARLRSYQGKDYRVARELIDSAVELSPLDANIANIKAVVIRNEIYRNFDQNRRERWALDGEYREFLTALIREALDTFRKSEKLHGVSTESNAVLIVSMASRVVSRLKPEDSSLAAFLTKPSSAVLADSMDEAEEAVARIEEITGDASLSDRVEGVLTDFEGLRDDDPDGMLQGWRNILDTSRGYKGPIRNRLARLYWDRSNKRSDPKSAKKAFELLNENLRDDPYDIRAIRLWLQVGRHVSASLDQAAIHCSNWVEADRGRESLYYDWVISALLCLDGRGGERPNFDRKLDLMRAAGKDMRNFRNVFDWVGKGDGLGKLVSATDSKLDSWDRKDRTKKEPSCLERVDAKVKKMNGRQSGWLLLEHDLQAFFTPHAAGLEPDKDEGTFVSALLGLTHDGIQAWAVNRC